MAIYKEDIAEIELKSGTIHRSFLGNSIGSGDKMANRFGVRLFRGGEPVSAESSTVTGVFMAPDGNRYAISETSYPGSTGKDGNSAWVQLPEICYAVAGQFCLSIKLSGGSVEGTMRIIDGVVSETGESGAVVPTSTIPTTAEIIAAYEDAVAVMGGSVRFDAVQTLTTAEKEKARGNIDAAWVGDVETLNGYIRDIVVLESGTFSDSDGVTKTNNAARQRNKTPLYVGNVAGIVIPDGYELYAFYLSDALEVIGRTSTWQTGYFNAFSNTSGAVYINFAVRDAESPTSDISTDSIVPTIIWRDSKNVIPRWNVNAGGIFIDGANIVVNKNGFGIIIEDHRYYIAPVDNETITTFTPPLPNSVYALVIDKLTLTTSGRNEPSTAMKIVEIDDKNINTDRYSTVAFYFSRRWGFVGNYSYFNAPEEIDYCAWNVARGGIKIDGVSVVVNANGFCVAYNGHSYYIAPVDMETVTTFTPAQLGSTYMLVLDPAKLTTPGARHDPADVLSIVDYYGPNYGNTYIEVANFYKGYWEFTGKFLYFSKSTDTEEVNSIGHVNGILLESHMIAHKGGSAAEENTIANFKAAAQDGFKAVEADIRYTSDGVMVLSHEPSFTVNGTTYVIAQNTYSDLVAVKPNLATFEELLILCKRTNMVIDVDFTKEYSTEQTDALYDMIVKYGATSRCLITCFGATARQLLNNQPMPICISQVTSTQAVDGIADIIALSSICYCSIYYNNATKALMEYMHEAGAFTKVWTIDSADTAVAMLENGADMIISNSLTDSVITDV